MSSTDVHSIISFDEEKPRRGATAWTAGFYAFVVLAVVLILVRAMWPPEERLTRDHAAVTQPR